MSSHRTRITKLRRGAHDRAPGAREVGARPFRTTWIDALFGLLAILLFACMAATASANDGGAVAEIGGQTAAEAGSETGVQRVRATARAERADAAANPQPVVAPAPTESLPVERGLAGWFAYRDARTGELTVVPPELLERFAAAGERERAVASAALVERRLSNGAIEIDFPVELSSPLYGWIDQHGVLRTGHAPPPGLDPKNSRDAERRGGR